MVRVEHLVADSHFAAVMLDGYAPEPQDFEALPWRDIRSRFRIPFEHWLSTVRATQLRLNHKYLEATYLTAYRHAVEEILRSGPVADREGLDLDYIGLVAVPGAMGYSGAAQDHRRSFHIRPELHSALETEYEHDRRENRQHYLQHVIIYGPNTLLMPDELWQECEQWIGALQFTEKARHSYLRGDEFEEAWSQILDEAVMRAEMEGR